MVVRHLSILCLAVVTTHRQAVSLVATYHLIPTLLNFAADDTANTLSSLGDSDVNGKNRESARTAPHQIWRTWTSFGGTGLLVVRGMTLPTRSRRRPLS